MDMIIPKVVSTLPFLLNRNNIYTITKPHTNRNTCIMSSSLFSSKEVRIVPIPEINFLSKPPSELSSDSSSTRYAKSIEYATAIQNSWEKDASKYPNMTSTVGFSVTYPCIEDKESITYLHGHAIYPSIESYKNSNVKLPGILFFHTAAGPRDICLHWKASSISSKLNCIVFICDILSDPNGWCWDDDRSQYNIISNMLKSKNENGVRECLQQRITASINTIKGMKNINDYLASFGWCLGGLPLMEIIKMNVPEMKVLVSFHGVFTDCYNDNHKLTSSNSKENKSDGTTYNELHVLVCNGENDPFISMKDIQALEQLFRENSKDFKSSWKLINYPNVKHGFTNPAQKFNTNSNFGYNEDAAFDSWNTALALVEKVLL